jgi:hypothetical protein
LDEEIQERIEFYETNLPKAREKYNAGLAEKEAEAIVKLENLIDQELTERYFWNKKIPMSGITGRPRYIRRAMGYRIEADFNEIIYKENPDKMLLRLGITNPADQKKMRGYLTARVIDLRRTITHKEISPVENQLLWAKPWAKAELPKLIARNESFKKALEEQIGAEFDGKNIPHSLFGRILKTVKDNPAMALMALGLAGQAVTSVTKEEEKQGS